jgi:hypothetical protein
MEMKILGKKKENYVIPSIRKEMKIIDNNENSAIPCVYKGMKTRSNSTITRVPQPKLGLLKKTKVKTMCENEWADTNCQVIRKFKEKFHEDYVNSKIIYNTHITVLALMYNRSMLGQVMYRRRYRGIIKHIEIVMLSANVPLQGSSKRLVSEIILAESDETVYVAAALAGSEKFWVSIGFVVCNDVEVRQSLLPDEHVDERANLPLYIRGLRPPTAPTDIQYTNT